MDLVCAQHMVTSLSQSTYWELHQFGMFVAFGDAEGQIDVVHQTDHEEDKLHLKRLFLTKAVIHFADKNIYVYRSRQGEVMEYNAETNKTTLVMDNSTFVSNPNVLTL